MSRWDCVAQGARTSLIALGLTLTLGILLILGSQRWSVRAREAVATAQRELAAQRATLSARQADLLYLERHAEQFRQLARGGLTEPAQREAWLEQLVASQQRTGLPETLRYSLQPGRPLLRMTALDATTPEAGVGQASFHDLEFTFAGIHEEELLALLQDYADHVPGRFRVNACELSQPMPSGLTAQCTLRFFTLATVRTRPQAP